MTIVPGVIGCYACSGADHWESACPEKQPPPEGATDRKAHEARIAKYVEWCTGNLPLPGRITPYQKQQLIKQENERYRKATARPKAGKAS